MLIGTRVPIVNPEGFFDLNEKKIENIKSGKRGGEKRIINNLINHYQ